VVGGPGTFDAAALAASAALAAASPALAAVLLLALEAALAAALLAVLEAASPALEAASAAAGISASPPPPPPPSATANGTLSPPINTLRVANSLKSPRIAKHDVMSPLGAQRAAGKPLISTDIEPRNTVAGGAPAAGGGWAGIPLLLAPEQMVVHVMYAAGCPSMNTGGDVGGASGGMITPDGARPSCVTVSPMRAAGNTIRLR
jgi:hypothetical protein